MSASLRTSVLVAVLLAGCSSPKSALERQIAGDGCTFESEYTVTSTTTPADDEEPYLCVRRKLSLWDWFAPPLEAECQEDAARCAARTKDKSLAPTLIRALSEEVDEYDTGDGKIYIRASFARALGILRDERAIEPLTAVLQSSNPAARTAAAEALGHFGEKARSAGPDLARAASVPNPEHDAELELLREAAAAALAKTAPKQACQ